MIIEYDIYCLERTLRIKFPEGYEHLKDEILEMLDKYYDIWMHIGEISDPEERDYVNNSCLEEYMIERLSETYAMWEEWESIDYEEEK